MIIRVEVDIEVNQPDEALAKRYAEQAVRETFTRSALMSVYTGLRYVPIHFRGVRGAEAIGEVDC